MDNFHAVLNDLKNKKYKPIYFLHGEEPYYIDLLSDYIEDHVLDENDKAFNFSVFYGRDAEVSQIIETAKRFPMMSPFQVVIVKEAKDLKKLELLESYFLNPLTSTILVICYKYKKADSRKKYIKAIKQNGVLFESKPLYTNQIPAWIQEAVHSKNQKISPKAAMLLAEFLGSDLQKINNELEKLKLVLGEGATVTPESIEENIGISKDFNNFELQNALCRKDAFKAFQIVQYFSQNPKEHSIFSVLWSLLDLYAKILTVQYQKNKSADHVASILKMNKFFVSDIIGASRAYSPVKVTEIISHIKDADLKAKGIGSTAQNTDDILKELIYKILN